jgi:hypothetical protein
MNERIKEIAVKAKVEHCISHVRLDDFAQLIVKECMEINKQELSFIAFETLLDRYNEHFGINE